LVERQIRFKQSPVRDDINFNRTIVILNNKVQILRILNIVITDPGKPEPVRKYEIQGANRHISELTFYIGNKNYPDIIIYPIRTALTI